MIRNASSPEWVVLFATALLLVTVGLGQEKAPAPAGRAPAALGQPSPSAAADASAQAAQVAAEWVKNNPPGRTTAQEHPVVKDNAYPRVSRDEREALGLPAPTWVAAHGKVQPVVRAALEEQRRLINSGDPMVEFQGDRPVGFQGMAYVDVYLQHEPKGKPSSPENQSAVRDIQTAILRKLTAAEFSLVFAFTNTAGLVGYVDEEGLARLVEDPTVVAIGLDDQARPEDPPIAMDERNGKVGPSERRGKVNTVVYQALEKSANGYVFVIVALERVSGATLEEKDVAARKLQRRVLSTLSAEDFRVACRPLGSGFDGYINAEGLTKLNNHPEVRAIGLRACFTTP